VCFWIDKWFILRIMLWKTNVVIYLNNPHPKFTYKQAGNF
jgi:hypothetical protein